MLKVSESKLWSSINKRKKYSELKSSNMEMLEQLRDNDFGLIEEIELEEGSLFDAEDAINS